MSRGLLFASVIFFGTLASPSLAGASSPTGVVQATIAVNGAPADVRAGIEACHATSGACDHPRVAEGPPGSPSSLVLAAGAWRITPFYAAQPFGGMARSKPRTLTVSAGQTTTFHKVLSYRQPGVVGGPLAVTGLPQGVAVTRFTVVACPPGVTYRGGTTPTGCAAEYSGTAGGGGIAPARRSPALGASGASTAATYSLPLPPGRWDLTPSYSTVFGSAVAATPATVKVVSGHRRRTPLSVPYAAPTRGEVSGTASIARAPSGFSGVVGVEACRSATPRPSSCPVIDYSAANGAYVVSLKPGTWWAVPFYVDFSTGDSVTGSPVQVSVHAGGTSTLDLAVTYR